MKEEAEYTAVFKDVKGNVALYKTAENYYGKPLPIFKNEEDARKAVEAAIEKDPNTEYTAIQSDDFDSIEMSYDPGSQRYAIYVTGGKTFKYIAYTPGYNDNEIYTGVRDASLAFDRNALIITPLS